MAILRFLEKFKALARSHSLHDPRTKLPFCFSIKAREEIVDFIHGSLIGTLLGFLIGFFILKTFF
ncbi:MAG: hypothetical protein QW063_00510 [Candidatus Nanoarchaeia archaeon]